MSAEDLPQTITVKEARERLGISRVTMARLLKEGRFTVYENPLDKREKRIPEAELERVKKLRLVPAVVVEQASKRAA